jgi:hypothetical protein
MFSASYQRYSGARLAGASAFLRVDAFAFLCVGAFALRCADAVVPQRHRQATTERRARRETFNLKRIDAKTRRLVDDSLVVCHVAAPAGCR